MKFIWIILVLPTFGIGHLVRDLRSQTQNMDGKSVHLSSDDRCVAAFNDRYRNSRVRLQNLYPDFEDLPEEVKRIIANMMFNMDTKII